MKTAVVIGATGLIGRELCELLADSSTYSQVLAIGRTPQIWINPKIKNIQFNFEHWTELESQLQGFIGLSACDGFCALGTTIGKAKTPENFKKVDLEYVVSFAKTLNKVQAQRFLVVSAMGADINSSVFYNQVKGEMEKQVSLLFNGTTSFIRPSLLIGNRSEFRFAEKMAIIMSPLLSAFLFGPFKKYRPIESRQVASAIVKIIENFQKPKAIYENDELANL